MADYAPFKRWNVGSTPTRSTNIVEAKSGLSTHGDARRGTGGPVVLHCEASGRHDGAVSKVYVRFRPERDKRGVCLPAAVSCARGGIGRRGGLKPHWPSGLESSTLSLRTKFRGWVKIPKKILKKESGC